MTMTDTIAHTEMKPHALIASDRVEGTVVRRPNSEKVGSIERLLGGSDLTSFLRGTADTWHDAVHSYSDIAVLYRTDAQSRALCGP